MADLHSILEKLVESQFDFVIIGGFAAVAHGATMLTEDLDVCCPFSEQNLLKLEDAIGGLHPVHRLVPGRPAYARSQVDISALKNLYLDTDWGALDCLSEVKGIGGFADVEKMSMAIQLPNGCCRVLKIDALIRAKEAMGTAKDKLTILQLRAIQRNSS